MEALIAWDQAATLWINQHHHPVLDGLVMPVAWFAEGGLGWIVIGVALLIFGGRRERLITLIFAAGLVLTEYGLMPVLRDLWPRTRPWLYLEGIRVLGVPWEKPSFPSAHMHLWGQAALLYSLAYPRWRGPLIVLTLLSLYSRPYAGMHHVLDSVAGLGLGLAVGGLEAAVARWRGLLRPVPAPPDEPERIRREYRAGRLRYQLTAIAAAVLLVPALIYPGVLLPLGPVGIAAALVLYGGGWALWNAHANGRCPACRRVVLLTSDSEAAPMWPARCPRCGAQLR